MPENRIERHAGDRGRTAARDGATTVVRALGLALAANFVAGGDAGAEIGPIQIVQASSAFDSVDWKQVTAHCPSGTIAFAGGANVDGDGPIVVHQSLPQGDPPSSWIALAQERSIHQESWSVTSWAHCATVEDYELVSEQSASNSSNTKEVAATCPPGKVAIGGGGGIFLFSPELVLTFAGKVSQSWRVEARELPVTSANWILRSSVSCAPDSLDIAAASGRTDNWIETTEDLALYCAAGQVPLAGGLSFTDAGLVASQPLADVGWYVRGRRLVGNPGESWFARGEVLCYRP
jgi:hypothetical protein